MPANLYVNFENMSTLLAMKEKTSNILIHTDLYTYPYKRGVIKDIGLYNFIMHLIGFYGIPSGIRITWLGSDIIIKGGIPFYLENLVKKIKRHCPQCIENT